MGQDETQDISRIGVVGARSVHINGMRDDDVYATTILNYLIETRVPFAKTLQIDAIDLNDGRDFLIEAAEYDLLVVSYVANPSPDVMSEFKRLSRSLPPEFVEALRVSPHHTQENWQKRLTTTGAKIVATVGTDRDEVHPGFLQSATHKALIPCGDFRSPGYRPVGDAPLTMGFMASADYLRNLPASVSLRTMLGSKMIAAARALKPAADQPGADL